MADRKTKLPTTGQKLIASMDGAKKSARSAAKAAHPFAPSGTFDDGDGQDDENSADSFEEQNRKANAGIYEPGSFGDQNARANATGFMSNSLPSDIPALGEPGKYVTSALAKNPKDRTPQETEALRVRRRAEEITMKGGRKVAGGIMADLVAEEKAPQIARREATAAGSYYEASEEVMANKYGRASNGQKLEPSAPGKASPAAQPSMQGATSKPVSSNFPETPGAIEAGKKLMGQMGRPAAATGFASRVMADGTVRTASGIDPNNPNASVMHNFGTRDEAMAFYRPAPAGPAPAGNIGQPAAGLPQPAITAAPAAAPGLNTVDKTTGMTMATKDAQGYAVTPQFADELRSRARTTNSGQQPAAPAIASPFTSPTAQLNSSMAATPKAAPMPVAAPVSAPAPAMAPVQPPQVALPPQIVNPFLSSKTPTMGTPLRKGFQEDAEELTTRVF